MGVANVISSCVRRDCACGLKVAYSASFFRVAMSWLLTFSNSTACLSSLFF